MSTTYLNDRVRVNGTLKVGIVFKITGGYSWVRFEDGSEQRFSQQTGKEYHGNSVINITSDEDIAQTTVFLENKAAMAAKKAAEREQQEQKDALIEAEWFRRFMRADGVEDLKVIALTELEGCTTVIFQYTPFSTWHRTEEYRGTEIATVVFKPELQEDYEATYKAYRAAQAEGIEITGELRESMRVMVPGFRANVGLTRVTGSSSTGRGDFAPTMEMALFKAMAYYMVPKPKFEELS